MIEGLTEQQIRKMHHFTQRLRDVLAVQINQGTTRDPREFREACELLNEVAEAMRPAVGTLPPGVTVDRRRNPR